MTIQLQYWINIILALSLVIPGFGFKKAQTSREAEITTIHLPLMMNQLQGMAYVSAGEFWMGCHGTECYYGSGAVHNIYLDAFLIDEYEITNAQYAECVTEGACQPPGAYGSHSRASYYDNPTYANYPVFHITWENALDYCEWQGKRLPTEAEWERAAQGGRDPYLAQYPWGDEAPVCDFGAPNGAHSSDCSPADSVEIGMFGPNQLGLYDMAGNVWEWVSDWYDLSYYSNSPYFNPQGPATGTDKVIRGGGWNYNTLGLRVFDRNFREPTDPLGWHDVGFRCVLVP